MRWQPFPRSDERGIVLVTVMLLIVLLSALGGVLVLSAATGTLVTRNQQVATEAQAAAEAGLSHAVELTMDHLRGWSGAGFASPSAAMTNLLRGPDRRSGTPAADADNGSLTPLGFPAEGGTLAGLPNAWYTARLYDEDDPARGTTMAAADWTRVGENGDTAADANTSMIVQAVGHSANGARVLVEATIAPTILPAIVVNDTLTISGSATVAGTHGDVHSNRNLTISGRVTIAGDATASGTYTASRRSTIGGATGGGYRPVTVSPVRASDHRAAATFVLTSRGRLTNPAGGTLCDASSRRTACQRAGYAWVYQNRSGWALTSDDRPMTGTYYVETDATISGSPGSASNPVQMSIITEGNLIVPGHPVLTASTPGLLFVTDMDLQLRGHLSTPMASEARILVRGQLEVSSHPTIAGQLLVEGADVGTLVTANTISGSPTIVYNGTGATTELAVASWRRVR